ncbi:MAG: hypothetical protein GY812_13725 [Actinomycetia bacterium]|nr:hypothetical protein [Actinomycetes bacterium]
MQPLMIRTLWGLADEPADQPDAIRDLGGSRLPWAAVASPVQMIPEPEPFADALEQAGLRYVPQVFSFASSVAEHTTMARSGLVAAAEFEPLHVVAQLGSDRWPPELAIGFIAEINRIAADLGLRILHETHRMRPFFNPLTTQRALAEIDGLELCADLSHWTCVLESLGLPEDILSDVAAATAQIDCRIGHEEGPQVGDPRSVRFRNNVATFEAWWQLIWDTQSKAGAEHLALAPEFGPPPYQPTDPHTGEPFADVNELNEWMAERLIERFWPKV